MPTFVPTADLAKILGTQTIQSSATTVADLLAEVERRLTPEQWNAARKVTMLVNGRNIHYLKGFKTPLEPDDEVWMVVPSGGG